MSFRATPGFACRLALAIALPLTLASPAPAAEEGASLYVRLCAACHGHGQQALGPYPALFGSGIVAAGGPSYVAIKVLAGAGNMFPFCAVLSDEEVADIASYLARANNSPAPIPTADEIRSMRPPKEHCADPAR